MSLLKYARKLYSLDTLDPRFTASRNFSPNYTAIDPAKPSPAEVGSRPISSNEARKKPTSDGSSSPLWGTTEFYIYYLVFLVCVPLMFKAVYDVSKRTLTEVLIRTLLSVLLTPIASHPNYAKYADLLSPGWIPGRKVDNSDDQYSTFRDNVPYMCLVLILHPLSRKVFEAIYSINEQRSSSSASKEPSNASHLAEARMRRRVTFDLYFAIVFLFALNGFSALKVLLILYTNYSLAKRVPKEYVSVATWTFNIGILFANELGKGYPFSAIASFVLPWSTSMAGEADQKAYTNWGSILDSYGGLIPRWEILFKITVLRLISFNMDFVWCLDVQGGSSPVEVCFHSWSPCFEYTKLIRIRRNNLTTQICPNGIGSVLQLGFKITPSEPI